MGIDITPSIIFGMMISYEEFVKIAEGLMTAEEKEEGDHQNFYYEHIESGGRFEEKYSGLYLGVACPYFDCNFEDRVFYLHLRQAEEFDIGECRNLVECQKYSSLKLCTDDNGIEYEDPKFIAIVNVF